MRLLKMAVTIDRSVGYKPFTQSHSNSFLELNQGNLAHSYEKVFRETNFHRSFSTPCLSMTMSTSVEEKIISIPQIEIVSGNDTLRVHTLVEEVGTAMLSGTCPTLMSNGLGGAYMFRSQNGNTIAVAKPADEEPLAVNNPKGFGGRMLGQPGLKRSVRIGETVIRELAAYLLDHGGFAGVPPTALVKLCHAAFHVTDAAAVSCLPCKIASLQRFVDHDYDSGEVGPSGFSVASVHHIGIFDVRLLNLDRHAGNMLVKKHEHDSCAIGFADLVPIDHGLCLPEWLDDPYFEWLHWPQAFVPFSDSEMKYISSLDPFEDAELLRTELPSLRESSIRVLVVCTIFLKRAAASGLCLSDIGEMMTRKFGDGEETSSELEQICSQAKTVTPCMSSDGLSEEENREEYGIFQFDNESSDCLLEIPNPPPILQPHSEMSQPSKGSGFPAAESLGEIFKVRISPSQEETTDDNMNNNTKMDKVENEDGRKEKCENHMEVGMIKSMSFTVPSHNCDVAGISFEDMGQWEWETFMESFEKLLPQVLESRKCPILKQRLGTSCKF